MANEIQVAYSKSGVAVYVLIRNAVGQVWNTGSSAFESYLTANYASYKVLLSEQGSASGFFAGNFPSAITGGVYSIVAKQQMGGSPAESDPTIATGDLEWSGTVTLPLTALASSGQIAQMSPIRMARGVMVQNFGVYMVSSADGKTPFTSGLCSGQISRDGGAFGALQSGVFSEVGQGFYNIVALTSGDLLCNTASLLVTANGVSGGSAIPRPLTFVLQGVSGS